MVQENCEKLRTIKARLRVSSDFHEENEKYLRNGNAQSVFFLDEIWLFLGVTAARPY